MPRRTGIDGPPRTYVAAGDWPDGRIEGPPPAQVAARLAAALQAAIGDRSLRAVAEQAGLHHTTVADVLAGRSWPDLVTIVRLQEALEVELWPDRNGG